MRLTGCQGEASGYPVCYMANSASKKSVLHMRRPEPWLACLPSIYSPTNPLTQATIHPFPPSNQPSDSPTNLSIYLSTHPSISIHPPPPSIHPTNQPTIHSTNHLSIHLTIQPTIHSNNHPSIHPSTNHPLDSHPSISSQPSIHPPIHPPSIDPSTHLFIHLFIHSSTHPLLIRHQSSVHPSSIRHPSIHPSPIHPSTHLVIPHPSATSRPGIPVPSSPPPCSHSLRTRQLPGSVPAAREEGDRLSQARSCPGEQRYGRCRMDGARGMNSLQPVAQVTGSGCLSSWLLLLLGRKTRSARHWLEGGDSQHGASPEGPTGAKRSLGDTRGTGLLICVAWCPLTACAHTSGPTVSRRVTHRCPPGWAVVADFRQGV